MIKEINNFFNKELFSEDYLPKIEYLTKYNFGKCENVKINALFGDKLIDFYLYKHCQENIGFETAKKFDNYRQTYTKDANWIKLFKEFNVEIYFDKEPNNEFGKENKAAFFEALAYEIYKNNPNDMKHVIEVIIKKVDMHLYQD